MVSRPIDLEGALVARLVDDPPAEAELPPELGLAVLRLDPGALLQRLRNAWAEAYADTLMRLLTAGPDNAVQPAPIPDEAVDAAVLVASLAAHDRRQTWRNAAAVGKIDVLLTAYRDSPSAFSDAAYDLLDAAIGCGQLAPLACLLQLARTPGRYAALDYPALRHTALELAAAHHQEAALALLLDDGADPARFDTAFWRLHFPQGPADPRIEDCLLERVPGYGAMRLGEAARASDWERVRAILARLDVRTRAEQAEEAVRAQAFVARLQLAGARLRSPAVLARLVGLWRQLAAGQALKAIAPELGRSVSQLSRLKAQLGESYSAIYGGPARFGPIEARRVLGGLRGQPLEPPIRAWWADEEDIG